MRYGQHQSFYLRDRWLSKAMTSIRKNADFFSQKDAFEKIGLGKNMVQSLKYWITALELYEESREDNKRIHKIKALGEFIEGTDKAVKYANTAALLHHSLATNRKDSPAWYWFFNVYNETAFTREEALQEFSNWVQQNEPKSVSENSLKRDIDCLVRLYTAGGSSSDPEEVILSPLYKLHLLEEHNNVFYKKEISSSANMVFIVAYTLLQYRDNCEEDVISDVISIDDIVHKEKLVGKLFNLKRADIVSIINEWTEHPKYPAIFTRTNNLDMVRLPNVDAYEFIWYEHGRKVEKTYAFER